jgi:hypothetical protein
MEATMRAYLVFTENGPILMMTSCASITDGCMLDSLCKKGIGKFIAYEVPLEAVHQAYGLPFEVVASDLKHGRQVRVLDFNGPHILDSFSLSDLGRPIRYEH